MDFGDGLIVGTIITILISALVMGIVINDNVMVEPETLDAVCKDKNPNTKYNYIDYDGNIVCKNLPNMTRLDHTNSFIYVDNGVEK